MDWLPNDSNNILALLGITIVIVVMLRLTIRRFRDNKEIQRQRNEAVQAAKRAEHKRQQESLFPKSKVSSPKTRAPLADPFSTPFAGNIQGLAAKWEAEIHQIGRQIIGQIDSKMSALQAITLEANRTANRLDILVEHLEELAKQQIALRHSYNGQNESENNTAAKGSSTVIPAAESAEAAPLSEVLKELTDDLEGIHHAIKNSTSFDEQPVQAVILRLSEIQTKNLRGEVEMLANYGMDSEGIAQRLGISPEEVDLILQVQQHR